MSHPTSPERFLLAEMYVSTDLFSLRLCPKAFSRPLWLTYMQLSIVSLEQERIKEPSILSYLELKKNTKDFESKPTAVRNLEFMVKSCNTLPTNLVPRFKERRQQEISLIDWTYKLISVTEKSLCPARSASITLSNVLRTGEV